MNKQLPIIFCLLSLFSWPVYFYLTYSVSAMVKAAAGNNNGNPLPVYKTLLFQLSNICSHFGLFIILLLILITFACFIWLGISFADQSREGKQ